MRWAIAVSWAVAACAPESAADKPMAIAQEHPKLAVAPIAADALCVTKGAAAVGGLVSEPTMRAFARGAGGDAASLTFVYRGATAVQRELASGAARRQLGLKLRAQDGCNLVYVMWRLDPKPALEVSVKLNPGKRTHAECGAAGYTKLAGAATPLPALVEGATHTLRAEIVGDELRAWVDAALVWRGAVPEAARAVVGPAGVRSDNVRFELVRFEAAAGAGAGAGVCGAERGD